MRGCRPPDFRDRKIAAPLKPLSIWRPASSEESAPNTLSQATQYRPTCQSAAFPAEIPQFLRFALPLFVTTPWSDDAAARVSLRNPPTPVARAVGMWESHEAGIRHHALKTGTGHRVPGPRNGPGGSRGDSPASVHGGQGTVPEGGRGQSREAGGDSPPVSTGGHRGQSPGGGGQSASVHAGDTGDSPRGGRGTVREGSWRGQSASVS